MYVSYSFYDDKKEPNYTKRVNHATFQKTNPYPLSFLIHQRGELVNPILFTN